MHSAVRPSPILASRRHRHCPLVLADSALPNLLKNWCVAHNLVTILSLYWVVQLKIMSDKHVTVWFLVNRMMYNNNNDRLTAFDPGQPG